MLAVTTPRNSIVAASSGTKQNQASIRRT